MANKMASDKQIKGEPVGIVIHKVDSEIKKKLDEMHEKNGIGDFGRMHDWFIHFLFDNRNRDLYQKDFEKQFSIGRSTVTGILQTLEKEGFITRECPNNDARLKKVVLTQKGIDFQLEQFENFHRFELNIRKDISEEELKVFYEVCEKVMHNLKNVQD